MKFSYYSDPSHGWLKVPRKLLISLGIDDKISTCSYERNDMVYLEHDDDAPLFIESMKKSGKTVEYKEYSTNRSSRIRSYAPYNRPNVKTMTRKPTKEDYAPVFRPVVNTSKSNINGTFIDVGDIVSFKGVSGKIISILPIDYNQDFILILENKDMTALVCRASECQC